MLALKHNKATKKKKRSLDESCESLTVGYTNGGETRRRLKHGSGYL